MTSSSAPAPLRLAGRDLFLFFSKYPGTLLGRLFRETGLQLPIDRVSYMYMRGTRTGDAPEGILNAIHQA